MIAQRLKQFRLSRGLTLEALSLRMGGLVTKQALSKYETGKSNPSPVVFNRLAEVLGVKAMEFYSEPPTTVSLVGYRKLSGLLKRDRATIESIVTRVLEERTKLSEIIGMPQRAKLPVSAFDVKSMDDAEIAADRVRSEWNLGTEPIPDLTAVLENRLVHVIEIPAPERFDGLSAIARSKRGKILSAAVITRSNSSGERQRLNLAHELGHLTLKISKGVDQEKAAFRFGSAFLAPASPFKSEVGFSRDTLHVEELILLKKRYGMSIQAILYRMRTLGIVSENYYRHWCISINRLGWRKNEPAQLEREKPKWLLQTVLRAFSEDLITKEKAESFLNSQLENHCPMGLVDRKAFMKLPIEQRRKIMEQQAHTLLKYYSDRPEVPDETGDLIEYPEHNSEARRSLDS